MLAVLVLYTWKMEMFPQVPLVSDRTTLEACQRAAGCVKKRSVSLSLSLEKTHLYKQCLPAISWTAPSQMCAHTHADSLNHAHTHTHTHVRTQTLSLTQTHTLTYTHTRSHTRVYLPRVCPGTG